MLKARDDRELFRVTTGPGRALKCDKNLVTHARTKILFYVPSLGDGGGERLWAALATAFHDAGHDVIFAVDVASEDSRHVLAADIPLTVLGRNHVTAIRNLARLLKTQRPDVALSAIAGANLKLIAACFLSRVPTKIIQTFHGHNEWKSGRLSYATARALPVTSRIVARTVAVSEPLRANLVSSWHAKSALTTCIVNPVLLPIAIKKPTGQDLKSRAPIILAVGRLSSDKDHATLIRAFALLNREDARLVIVGKGPEEDSIRHLIVSLGLQEKVSLAGYSAEPWPYFERAKCLALSSKSESFGNVIVEALAHGLPVVATNTDGPQHILSTPDLGTCVPVGDAKAMAAALAATLDNPGDPLPRFERATLFSMENRLPAYEALIADVLDHTRAPPDHVRRKSERGGQAS